MEDCLQQIYLELQDFRLRKRGQSYADYRLCPLLLPKLSQSMQLSPLFALPWQIGAARHQRGKQPISHSSRGWVIIQYLNGQTPQTSCQGGCDVWAVGCQYNNFMSDSKARTKNENLKTEAAVAGKGCEVELGKPVKLPYIRKISTNTHNPHISRHSLQSKQTRVMRNSNKQLQLMDQTHLHLLTLQQIQLCNEKNREPLPRIPQPPPHPLFHRERSIDSLDPQPKIRSEKSITKIDFSEQLRDYRLGALLGRGTYSQVRLARNREGRKFAVKTYLRASLSNEDRRNNLEREVAILATVQHPCLLGYQETIETEDSINIVTQLFDSRSLNDYLRSDCLKSLLQQQIRTILRQLVKALVYLHGRDIVHRDLKLQNVLLNRQLRIKLIDFGFSRQLPKQNYILYDFCGTPHYIAPEVMQREGYYGKPADVWSLGVLGYRLATGLFPFKGNNEKALFSSVMKGEVKYPGEMSNQLASLLGRMLSLDFRKRPTMEEIASSQWLEMQP